MGAVVVLVHLERVRIDDGHDVGAAERGVRDRRGRVAEVLGLAARCAVVGLVAEVKGRVRSAGVVRIAPVLVPVCVTMITGSPVSRSVVPSFPPLRS